MTISPLDHVFFGHIGACYLSEESGMGTLGTERRAWPVADTAEAVPTQESVDNKSLSSRAHDAETPLQGDKGGTVKLSYYLQPPATVNATGATPDTSSTNPLRIPLKVLFGGESVAAGSTVATGTSASAIVVASGHGVRMTAGQLIAVATDSSYGFELAQVRSRATDDLTLYPYLSATPATSQAVTNLNTYYPTSANSLSMSVALSSLNTDRQVCMRGCTGSAALKFERSSLAVIDLTLNAATFDGPSALGYSVARVEDTMAAPLAVRNSICWLQATSTTTRVNTAVDAVNITLNFGNVHLTSLTGTLEGKRAVHRGEGLTDAFAKIELTLPDNTDVFTWYAAQTELNFTFIVKVDPAAGGRRFVAVMAPQCVIESYPEIMKGEGNLTKVKVMLRAKVSEQCSGTITTAELASAPFLLALG
jgi:hypothetical protein